MELLASLLYIRSRIQQIHRVIMAFGLNRVSLLGNVGQAPEIRVTQDGREFATFWVATVDTWKDAITGDRKENTEWHRIVAFSESLVGLIRNHVKKGSKLYLEGALRTRKFTDAATGQERQITEIALQGNSVLVLLDAKPKPQQERESDRGGKSSAGLELDDSVPF